MSLAKDLALTEHGRRESASQHPSTVHRPPSIHNLLPLLACLLLLAPTRVQLAPGPPQTVRTNNALAGMHTRFIDEVDDWKLAHGMRMVREMGAGWIVEAFPWMYVEPARGRFDWAQADRVIAHANANGLQVIARLGFVPQWARPVRNAAGNPTTVTHLDPEHYEDFARYAAAFAARYAGQVHAVIIWNEPNLTAEWGLRQPDPEDYAQLLLTSYGAIKQANPVVLVLAGALAPTTEPPGSILAMNDLTYLQRIYDALAPISNRPYDGWAVHSYGTTFAPEAPPNPQQINFRRAELLRGIMLRNGDDAPVYITEAGWNDDRNWINAVSPAERIEHTQAALAYAQSNWPWCRTVAFWVFKLPAPARGYRDRFTFVTPDLQPLPIYDELKQHLAR